MTNVITAPNPVVDRIETGGTSAEERSISYTQDAPLNRMLTTVVDEVRKYAEIQSRHIKKLHEIGIALSAEQNLDMLLEKILDEARSFSRADGGTLYVVDSEQECLQFAIVQTESMNIRMGGTGRPISWPPIPLKVEGKPNHANVSSYVALTGNIVNIPDVYAADEFDFTGTRKFDATTGYSCHSMVVIPMRNKANEIIGVLQLINEIDPASGKPVPFSDDHVTLITSLASLAAVAITNVRLYTDLEKLLESFIVTIATAIDEKSPYTAGHIKRVEDLTMTIASCLNEQQEGVFKDFFLNDEELNELRIAAWLHDVGKIITPEHVVDKSTKLERIYDGIDLISRRFDLFRQEAKIRFLEAKVRLYETGESTPESLDDLRKSYMQEDALLAEEAEFLARCNQPGEFMDADKVARLQAIGAKSGFFDGREVPYLTDHELADLSIRKGSLNEKEREIIENHALVTMKMLKCLPFPRKLRHVPEYASYHHEKLDGSGYPFRLSARDLKYQTRIIAIADIFEALTARDRPYKKPMTVAKALEILAFMKKDGHIDGDIFDLMLEKGIFQEYAARTSDKTQTNC